jgi:hypothetical protein
MISITKKKDTRFTRQRIYLPVNEKLSSLYFIFHSKTIVQLSLYFNAKKVKVFGITTINYYNGKKSFLNKIDCTKSF